MNWNVADLINAVFDQQIHEGAMAKYEEVGRIYKRKNNGGWVGILITVVIILIIASQCT